MMPQTARWQTLQWIENVLPVLHAFKAIAVVIFGSTGGQENKSLKFFYPLHPSILVT